MSKIMGVDTEKVTEAVVDRYLLGFKITTSGRLNRKIRILAKHFADEKSKAGDDYEEVVCTTCGADSPASLPECPFCGDSEEADEAPKVTGKPKPEDDDDEPEQEPEDDDAESEAEPEEEQEAPKPKAKKQTKLEREREAANADRVNAAIDRALKEKAEKKPKKAVKEEEPEEAPPKPALAKRSSKTKVEVTTEPVEVAVVEDSAGKKKIERKKTAEVVVFSEADLDESVIEAKKYMASATLEAFRLGRVLKHIHDNNLYLMRKDQKGAPTHLSFKAFVRSEFEISHQQAYNLMAVAEHFTEEEVNRIGVSKLKLALQLPKDVRDGILADAEEGATMSQLSERANKLLEKPEKPRKEVREDGALTAILAMGILEAPMFCAPKKPGKVGAKTKPARTAADMPFSVFQLENDVIATVRIENNDDGELVSSLMFRKGKEGE